MPAADATVEYVLAAAKQTAEEVDDTVLAVANLADHGADQHKECDDERVPQAQCKYQHGEDKACHGTERSVGVAHGVAPDSSARTFDETHGLVKVISGAVVLLAGLGLGVGGLACRRSVLVDRQARRAGALVLVGIPHRKPPRSGR